MKNLFDRYLLEEKLDDNKHFEEVSYFSCGNEALDLFLKCEAFKYNEDGQGNTYIIKLKDTDEIIGYYTLKANTIQIYNIKTRIKESHPAIEIARLAVNNDYKNNKFGTTIFFHYILPKIKEVKKLIGINTIMLFSIHEDIDEYEHINNKKTLKYFYEKLGFNLAEDEVQKFIEDDYNEGCKLMYMSI
nr:N-acetyltransferase [uncultured Tyzzerella sp.]